MIATFSLDPFRVTSHGRMNKANAFLILPATLMMFVMTEWVKSVEMRYYVGGFTWILLVCLIILINLSYT